MDNPEHPSGKTLLQRARKGVIWVGFVTLGSKALSVATTLVLARILAPQEFGLVAVANIVVAALSIFTDLGLGAAIIHSKEDRQRMASTAFYMMPIIGVCLYLVSFLTAPLLANLLGNAAAATLIQIMALNLIIASFTIVPSVLLEKDMAYRRKVLPDLVPTIVYIVFAIMFAKVYHMGAFSIAYALVLQGLTNLVLNWLVVRWHPSLIFDRQIAGRLFTYGKNVLGGSIVVYLATNMDNTFVSKTTGAAALGYYALAYSIANLPATHVADVIGRVLFPSFVEMNQDSERLRTAYRRALVLLIVITFPMLAGIAAIAPTFVGLVLGAKWLPIVGALQVLIVFTAFRVLSGPTGSLFLATNRSKIILYSGFVGLALQAICLYVALVIMHSGIAGASWAVSIASAANGLYIGYWVYKIMPFRVDRALVSAVRLAFPAVAMGIVIDAIGRQLSHSVVSLMVQIVAGIIIYATIFIVFNGWTITNELIKLALKQKEPSLSAP